jgi:hypothetical protein
MEVKQLYTKIIKGWLSSASGKNLIKDAMRQLLAGNINDFQPYSKTAL